MVCIEILNPPKEFRSHYRNSPLNNFPAYERVISRNDLFLVTSNTRKTKADRYKKQSGKQTLTH